jgi:hypothetical protein
VLGVVVVVGAVLCGLCPFRLCSFSFFSFSCCCVEGVSCDVVVLAAVVVVVLVGHVLLSVVVDGGSEGLFGVVVWVVAVDSLLSVLCFCRPSSHRRVRLLLVVCLFRR